MIASIVAGLLAIGGVAACARAGSTSLWIGSALLVLVLLYNFALKKYALLGVLNMGLCRGASLLLGASAVTLPQRFSFAVLVAAGITTAYTASVTQCARRETMPHNPGLERWIPAVTLIMGGIFFWPYMHSAPELWRGFLTAYSMALVMTLIFGIRMQGFILTANLPKTLDSQQRIVRELPHWIGWLIANLLIINGAFVLSTGNTDLIRLALPVLAVCWLLNRVLAIFIPAS